MSALRTSAKQHLVGTLLMSQSCSQCIWFYEFLDKGRFSLLLHQIGSACGKGGRRPWVRGKASIALPFTLVVTLSLGVRVQQLFSVATRKVTGVSLAFSWGGRHTDQGRRSLAGNRGPCRKENEKPALGWLGGSWGSSRVRRE